MLNPLNILSKFFKSSNQKELERLNKLAIKIKELEEQTLKLEDKDFPLKTNEFIEKIWFISWIYIGISLDFMDSEESDVKIRVEI